VIGIAAMHGHSYGCSSFTRCSSIFQLSEAVFAIRTDSSELLIFPSHLYTEKILGIILAQAIMFSSTRILAALEASSNDGKVMYISIISFMMIKNKQIQSTKQ